ncbi:MAG: peptidyl-prolyl cis-trans isomerase [Solirubrobacterales bacterium]
MGAKAGQRGNRGRDRAAGRQRLGLILFGALFVLLFVIFAVTEGIGSPSVPSGDVAKVQGVSDELANVSKKEFDKALERQVAGAKLKKPPAPGSKKYEELKEAVVTELLEAIWIRGEAEALGIKITSKQIEEELAQVKKTSFPSESAYKKFLKESKLSEEDVSNIIETKALGTAIEGQIKSEVPAPSSSEIESYYQAEKTAQFTEKESRDARIIINKDKGKVEAAKKLLEKDNSPANWKKVAGKYSSSPTAASKGGLQEGITEEALAAPGAGPLKTAIFGSATGELQGPVKLESNWFVVEVVKLNPAKVKSLGEVKAQIEETLKAEKQQEFFSEWVNGYFVRWTSRTQCASGFEVEKCADFKTSGHPKSAPSACFETNPKTPATACPAIVTPTSPALPGSVTEQKPKGEPFQQRPLPESTGEEGAAATEVPAGAAPEGEAAPEGGEAGTESPEGSTGE